MFQSQSYDFSGYINTNQANTITCAAQRKQRNKLRFQTEEKKKTQMCFYIRNAIERDDYRF